MKTKDIIAMLDEWAAQTGRSYVLGLAASDKTGENIYGVVSSAGDIEQMEVAHSAIGDYIEAMSSGTMDQDAYEWSAERATISKAI